MNADLDRSTLDALFAQRLQAFFDAIPADAKSWKPTSWEEIHSESFSAIEQICRVRDIEVDASRPR
jgi:hypothetical protein